jgi:hypothetical protein
MTPTIGFLNFWIATFKVKFLRKKQHTVDDFLNLKVWGAVVCSTQVILTTQKWVVFEKQELL